MLGLIHNDDWNEGVWYMVRRKERKRKEVAGPLGQCDKKSPVEATHMTNHGPPIFSSEDLEGGEQEDLRKTDSTMEWQRYDIRINDINSVRLKGPGGAQWLGG